MSTKQPIFFKSLFGLSFAIILGLLLYARSEKSKSAFQKTTGVIVFFDKSIEGLPNRGTSKHRYLKIDNHPKVFELFIGKDAGDFKPEFERIDKLKIHDTITIFFDENINTLSDPINRLVYFIDRGQETMFIKGGWEKYMAIFIIGASISILIAVFILKRRGKID